MVSVPFQAFSQLHDPLLRYQPFYQLIQQGEKRNLASSYQGPRSLSPWCWPYTYHHSHRGQGRHYIPVASLLQQSYHHGSISRSLRKQKPSRYPCRSDYQEQWYHHKRRSQGYPYWQWQSSNQACSCHNPRWLQRHPRCDRP